MRFRYASMVLALLLYATLASAQQTGEISGRVTDASEAVMPGVTVTLTSPVLLNPMTAVTGPTGAYRFPQLPIGTYTVKFELPGFKTVIREGVRIEIGFTAQINATLEISTVEETVTVTGESPIIDLRDTGKTSRFNQEALQSLPSARDPWVIIEQAAGVAMDRQNVGGSASGQQSNFVARGAAMREQKWNLDGVDITDMSATGGSPIYFDFDAFEEMQISAGGADVTMQSPGVAVNLVTKSGTDTLRGSGRWYLTDDKFQSINVDNALRKQGAATGNPIQRITDYGLEAGGPIKRGRAWFWGSYGKQDISVGINNFFKGDAACQAMKKALAADPTSIPIKDVRGCLNSDSTLLNNYNAKVAVELFKNNQFSFLMNAAEKVRNARDASDLRPLETTYRQLGVTRKDLGSNWWKTGMPKTYKWSDRHIFSDRFMAEVSYAHVGNNFALTFHEEELRGVQAMYEATSQLWGRSYNESVYVRPTDSIDIMGNYFMPGWLGGDHAIKFGFKYRNDIAHTETAYGGDAYVRFNSVNLPAFTTPESAYLYRRGYSEYGLHNRNFYVQDSYSVKRMTINLGLRFDFQTDFVNPAKVAAHEFFGQSTFAGEYNDGGLFAGRYNGTYTGAKFDQLPDIAFKGAEAGVSWKNWSPRIGFTYDLRGTGRQVVKLNYGRYVGQLGTGTMSSVYNPVASTYVRYPWVDLNGDKFVQANEVVLTTAKGIAPIQSTSGYNYNNPSQLTTTGKVDPKLTADKTDEILISFDQQLGPDFAVSAAYIWRKYTNFRWSPLDNFSAANYEAVKWTPTAGTCPAGAHCPEVTYYRRTSQPGTAYTYTNQPDYWRDFNGFEITARKRLSKGWLMNASFSYNDAKEHYDSPAAYQDPTNIDKFNTGQYAPESTSSGLGNVFVNARWLFRVSGVYQLPWQHINVSAFYNSRDGYPLIRDVLGPSRPYGQSAPAINLDRIGDVRLPNFQTLDFRVDKVFTLLDRVRVTASMDVFNMLNGNTALSIRGRQNASNANTISSLLAPRVIRFGFRATF
ncbi:MAG: carboxypeptidase regulatory-like domain-containing protein [Vicinamibacterales bacterium]